MRNASGRQASADIMSPRARSISRPAPLPWTLRPSLRRRSRRRPSCALGTTKARAPAIRVSAPGVSTTDRVPSRRPRSVQRPTASMRIRAHITRLARRCSHEALRRMRKAHPEGEGERCRAPLLRQGAVPQDLLRREGAHALPPVLHSTPQGPCLPAHGDLHGLRAGHQHHSRPRCAPLGIVPTAADKATRPRALQGPARYRRREAVLNAAPTKERMCLESARQ